MTYKVTIKCSIEVVKLNQIWVIKYNISQPSGIICINGSFVKWQFFQKHEFSHFSELEMIMSCWGWFLYSESMFSQLIINILQDLSRRKSKIQDLVIIEISLSSSWVDIPLSAGKSNIQVNLNLNKHGLAGPKLDKRDVTSRINYSRLSSG